MHKFIVWLAAANVRQWATILAGVVQTILAVSLILILWHGGWDPSTAPKRIDFLGYSLILCLLINGLVIVSLSGARFSAHGPLGTGFQADPGNGDERKPVATIEGVVKPLPDSPKE